MNNSAMGVVDDAWVERFDAQSKQPTRAKCPFCKRRLERIQVQISYAEGYTEIRDIYLCRKERLMCRRRRHIRAATIEELDEQRRWGELPYATPQL